MSVSIIFFPLIAQPYSEHNCSLINFSHAYCLMSDSRASESTCRPTVWRQRQGEATEDKTKVAHREAPDTESRKGQLSLVLPHTHTHMHTHSCSPSSSLAVTTSVRPCWASAASMPALHRALQAANGICCTWHAAEPKINPEPAVHTHHVQYDRTKPGGLHLSLTKHDLS